MMTQSVNQYLIYRVLFIHKEVAQSPVHKTLATPHPQQHQIKSESKHINKQIKIENSQKCKRIR